MKNNPMKDIVSSFFYFLFQILGRLQLAWSYILKKMKENDRYMIDVDEDDEDDEEEDYANKYKDKFDLLNKQITYSVDFNDVLDNYKNNYVLETTPLGNVAMCYNNKTKYFEYYSDKIIPYRFLETIARKYVIQNKCPFIYNLELTEEEEKKEKKEEAEKKKNIMFEKPKVFAKFKNYQLQAPPAQKNITNNNVDNNVNNEDNKTNNRYLCKGRFSNYPILQKIDRKKIDKEYAMSYKDFKNKAII